MTAQTLQTMYSRSPQWAAAHDLCLCVPVCATTRISFTKDTGGVNPGSRMLNT